MNSDYKRILKDTESKWLDLLFIQVKEIFANESLPSHNEEHHLRVWNYAKDLLSELDSRGIKVDHDSLEEIIITVFFHDTGMSVNREQDHGKASRKLCEEWMDKAGFPINESRKKILDAIEHHDNKTYLNPGGFLSGGQLNLLTLLNICDDLDAFGYTGIYRYCEIYLLRGIAIEELGQQVISNASRRFGNFMMQCMQYPGMIKTHTPRYDILENFFRQYNAQLRKDPTGKSINHGPVHIVKIFYRQIMSGTDSVESLCSSLINQYDGMYEKSFFENLKGEWCSK